MSFVINEKEKDLPALTKFHVPYPGLNKLTNEIDKLEQNELFDKKFGHYKTTHEQDFPGYQSGLYAEAHRPAENGTEKSIAPPAKSVWSTTAQSNFGWKACEKTEPIRSGTASGQRRNNPHPHEAFMNWKLNKNKVISDTRNLEISDEPKLKKILRDQLTSTYENDFLDNTENITELRELANAELHDWQHPKVVVPEENTEAEMRDVDKKQNGKWSEQVEHDFATRQYLSSNAVTYRQPVHHRHLNDNTTRYGCNKNKMKAAVGAVPTVIQKYVDRDNMPTITSYQHQFSTKNGKNPS